MDTDTRHVIEFKTVKEWQASIQGDAHEAFSNTLQKLHAIPDDSEAGSQLLEKLKNVYQSVLKHAADNLGEDTRGLLVRAPARVNLMGMHIDGRGGAINPIALMETVAFISPRPDDHVVVENIEAQYERREFIISEELPKARVLDWEAWTREQYAKRAKAGTAGDWSDYVKAAILYYHNRHKGPTGQSQIEVSGMNMVFGSVVPAAAGLSSSSAMVVASFISALTISGELNEVSPEDLIDWCGIAEWYVGTRGGKGDHASIICGKPASVLHLKFFPTQIQSFALPPGMAIVMANSRVEAKKSAGARDFFNQRIAGFVIGEHLLKKVDAERFGSLENLASCTPSRLGYPEEILLKLLKQIPENSTRSEALALLADVPGVTDKLERIFDSHKEPAEGYEVRQILLYGLTEVERSDRGSKVLAEGDVKGFGELMNLSHDGDRLFQNTIDATGKVNGSESIDNRATDEMVDRWIAESKPLWKIPGGYGASVEQTDLIVDLARSVDGVYGARLIGAGRGGCVGILCKQEAVEPVLKRLQDGYYTPKGLEENSVFVACPSEGAGLFRAT